MQKLLKYRAHLLSRRIKKLTDIEVVYPRNLLGNITMPFGAQSERGAVLIVLAFLAVGLITFVALGVDTGLISATRRDHTSLAPTVATTALNTFSRSTGTRSQRLDAARDRAQELAQFNVDISTTTNFLKDQGSGNTQDLGIGIGAAGATGYITAGIWHFVPTYTAPHFDPSTGECIGSQPCPCGQGGIWNGPCFEAIEDVDASAAPITAIYAEVRTRADKPMQTKFSGVDGGRTDFHFTASATVALRPMRTVTYVDLSRRSHSLTHLPYEMAGALPSSFSTAEYAYRITNKACLNDTPSSFPVADAIDLKYVQGNLSCVPQAAPPATFDCNGTNIPGVLGPTDCQFAGGWSVAGINGVFSAIYNYCSNPHPIIRPAGNPVHNSWNTTIHSKSDYRCYNVTYQEGSEPSKTESFLVDVYRGNKYSKAAGQPVEYRGPEPLNTMLFAVEQSLEKYVERNVDRDMVAVYGIDQRVDVDIRSFPLMEASLNNSDFTDMQEVFVDRIDPATLNLRHGEHFFFPRDDALLNLPDAIRLGYTEIISQPDYPFTENQLIMIINGPSECWEHPVDGHVCGTDQASIEASIDQTISLANQLLVPNNIKLHIIMVGGVVQPHSLARRGNTASSENQCMDENEARENNHDWVDYSTNTASYNDARDKANADSNGDLQFGDSDRYFYANRLYEAVRATGGEWGIVRPPCDPSAVQLGGGSCADGALEDWLDSECASLSNRGDRMGQRAGNSGNITDADGRLVCDPTCRSMREQITEIVDNIFDSQPYLAVDHSVRVN